LRYKNATFTKIVGDLVGKLARGIWKTVFHRLGWKKGYPSFNNKID